jgi:drug/metabolite transporter (DMT)-like permease
MDSKSIGKNYFPNFNNSAFDSGSLKSFNKSNYGNNEGGDLMEMMVMQKYGGDNVRYQYVEEPSKRGSFLEEKNDKVEEEVKLTPQMCLIKMTISFVCFGVMTFIFKVMFQNFRHTIYEDLYGRGVVFFFCSIVHYLKQKGIISLFDIRPQIRVSFFLRVLFICLAYVSYYLALVNTSSFTYVALILCMLPLLCKIIQRIANIEKKFTFWDILNLGISFAGMVILYSSNGNYTNNLTQSFDNTRAYIYGIVCIIFWSMSNYFLHKNAIYVHHTIDTLYVALFNSILIPSFLLGYFSFHPTSLTYNWE